MLSPIAQIALLSFTAIIFVLFMARSFWILRKELKELFKELFK